MLRKSILFSCLVGLLLIASCKRGANTGSSAAGADSPAASSTSDPNESFRAGEKAPEFEFVNLEGKKFSTKDFHGKTVLLNFWATWCVPCVAEMPALERLYKTHKDKGLEIVAINVDPPDSREAVKKFVSDNGLTFTVLLDSDFSLPTVYKLTGFPESFFLGKDGSFLEFRDPSYGKSVVRVVGDRPWDAETFIASMGELVSAK